MKRPITWTGCLVALGAAVYFGSTLGAQQIRFGAPLQPRVALLNLRLTIKQYARYEAFVNELKKRDETFVKAIKEKQAEQELLEIAASKVQGAEREAKEQAIRKVQQEIEDLTQSARKEVTDGASREMAATYKDIRDAVSQYAKTHKLDLVLHYEGPIDEEEVDSPARIKRNMDAGGCVPIYCNPDIDITSAVVEFLNQQYKQKGKVPPMERVP